MHQAKQAIASIIVIITREPKTLSTTITGIGNFSESLAKRHLKNHFESLQGSFRVVSMIIEDSSPETVPLIISANLSLECALNVFCDIVKCRSVGSSNISSRTIDR